MERSILEWLLEEDTPGVRLRTLKEYEKLPEGNEAVVECKKLLLQSIRTRSEKAPDRQALGKV